MVLADFVECFGFDLTNAFAGNAKDFTDFFERMGNTIGKAETHFKNLLFAFGKIADNFIEMVLQNPATGNGFRRDGIFIGNEVGKHRITLIIPNRGLKRYRVLRNFDDMANLLNFDAGRLAGTY